MSIAWNSAPTGSEPSPQHEAPARCCAGIWKSPSCSRSSSGCGRHALHSHVEHKPTVKASSHPDHNLAEVRAALQVAERRRCFPEWEHAVDYWPNLLLRDYAVHRLEHRSRADEHSLHSDSLHQHEHWVKSTQ